MLYLIVFLMVVGAAAAYFMMNQRSGDGPELKTRVSSKMFVNKGKGLLRDVYKIGEILGEGAFGEVRLVTHRQTQEKFAVKVLKKEKMDAAEKATMLNEIQTLKNLDHPNIIRVFEYFEDASKFYIVTEFVQGGELFDEVVNRGHFNEKDAAVVMKHVLSCISYCHANDIMHRDLKPENVLLEASKEFDQLKVIDFGTAQRYKPGQKLKDAIGTPYYIAPEVLNQNYSNKCDVWSIGVICYILLCGSAPFDGDDDSEIVKAIKKGTFNFNADVWKDVSQQAKDFITQLLTYDMDKRPTAADCLKHPWIQDNSKFTVDANINKAAIGNLGKFQGEATIKSATLNFIGSQLISKTEREELARVFKKMDVDGDGRLSKQEVKDGYESAFGCLISTEEVDKMFEAVDTDGSGFIDYTEFVVASMNSQAALSEERLKAAFNMFDKDGDGTISIAEVRDVFQAQENKMPKSVLDKILKQVDENGDGEISFEEFSHLMKNASA